MIAVAVVVATGLVRGWGDSEYLLFGIATALPALVGPLLWRHQPRGPGVPYWIKLNVWVAIVVFFGTYIGTHYFFDLMGMRYAFPCTWTFSAEVVGRTPGKVPVFMYPLTHAYFVTYYTVLVVAMRGLESMFRPSKLGRAAIVLGLAYLLAFLETFFMASEALGDWFGYADRERMLYLGSLGYAAYFVVGLPLLRGMDEGDEPWSLRQVVLNALASCMAILLLLEAWAKLVGPL